MIMTGVYLALHKEKLKSKVELLAPKAKNELPKPQNQVKNAASNGRRNASSLCQTSKLYRQLPEEPGLHTFL